uniref:Macaca fascicularis brain cDNA clone: QflA-18457, similar to human cyclic AMP phosphoprotein, 19 kD (ARPP-19), mRNA, RefSeq: NM_006628.2 n=1 Tax=Macaca fascicularis TaxID=9541 RepID=I7GLJ3_MACFA|nr:unnamed protein product [Macaca fascicularis]
MILRISSLRCYCFSLRLRLAESLPFLDPGIFSESWFHQYTCSPVISNHTQWCLEHSTFG